MFKPSAQLSLTTYRRVSQHNWLSLRRIRSKRVTLTEIRQQSFNSSHAVVLHPLLAREATYRNGIIFESISISSHDRPYHFVKVCTAGLTKLPSPPCNCLPLGLSCPTITSALRASSVS
ncbi:MAG: hypothetical protein ACTS5F_02185 [Candidatus Hodgkinia cicadicola]